ncbi:MAG: hypothetical protein ABH863_01320 [Candidatus Micrarchaeota archaeon]
MKMTEFGLAANKLGDPLLDISINACSCYCLIDRSHRKILFSVADARFPSLKDEARMLWLREFGTVSDALDSFFAFPPYVEEINASIIPPDQFSPEKKVKISLSGKLSRESVAWFSRGLSQLLEDEGSKGAKPPFVLEWANHAGEEFLAPLADFEKRPRVVSQTR